MTTQYGQEILMQTTVNYTMEFEGRLIVIENVPARINRETGEQFFSPDTVENLQELIWNGLEPQRVIEVPVYQYESSAA